MPVSITRTDNASEAAQIIAQDSNAYILGGGTGLMRRIHEGDQNVRHLVRLQSQELIKIVKLGTTIRIGSQVTMAQILADQSIQILHKTAASVGAPACAIWQQLEVTYSRGRPTAITTALLALNAQVFFINGTREDQQPLSQFLLRSGPRQLVLAIEISNKTNQNFIYKKMTRSHPRGASVVTLACDFAHSAGRISKAAIAFGGLAGRPFRASVVERSIDGNLTNTSIENACRSLKNEVKPFSDSLASGWYRMEMAQLLLRRTLADLL